MWRRKIGQVCQFSSFEIIVIAITRNYGFVFSKIGRLYVMTINGYDILFLFAFDIDRIISL